MKLKSLCIGGIVVAVAQVMSPSYGPAAQAQPASHYCGTGTICDHALGISLRPAPGVFVAPTNRYPPHHLAFETETRGHVIGSVRLDISSWGLAANKTDRQAARYGMGRLLATQKTHDGIARVVYGGAPGFSARGLHGPGPVIAIILAHRGALYKLLAPGNQLRNDQRQMLSSLRFIQRHGPFPPSNG